MPRISVVVQTRGQSPDRCLASVAGQRVDDVEVLVDGDPAVARGDHLVVLGPADELAPLGLATLLAALDASGSDLALGTGGNRAVAALRAAVTAATATALPALLEHSDLAAVLFRTAFLDGSTGRPATGAYGLGFLARAVLAARAVDVVPEPVTLAQAGVQRTGRAPSLRADQVDELVDRLADLAGVADEVTTDDLRTHWLRAVLEPAVRAALAHLPDFDADGRDRLTACAGQVVANHALDEWSDVRAVHRLQYHLSRRGLPAPLLDVVKAERSGDLARTHAVRHRGTWYADYPFRDDPALGVPRAIYRLDREHALRGGVEDVRWEGETLHLEGLAHLGMLDAGSPRAQRLQVDLVRAGSDDRVTLHVARVRRPDVTAGTKEATYCYDWSGFRTSVDARRLRGRTGWTHGVWRLEATVSAAGVTRTRLLTTVSPGRARHPTLLRADDVRLVPATGRGTFAIEVDPMPGTVTSTGVRDGSVVLAGEVRRRPKAAGDATARLQRPSGATAVTVDGVELVPADGRRTFVVSLRLAALVEAAAEEAVGEVTWSLTLDLPGTGRPLPLRAADGLPPLRTVVGGTEVTVEATPHGRLAVSAEPARPAVDAARWVGDDLELAGRWPAGEHELVLVAADGRREHAVRPEAAGGRFRLRFRPGAMPSLAGTLPLTQGDWLPVVRTKGRPHPRPLRADAPVLATLDLRHRIGAKEFRLTEDDGALELHAGPDLLDDERGAANQHRLHQRDFPRFLSAGLREEVLFEGYGSRAYADNARAVVEELRRRGSDLRCRWVTLDGQASLPPGVEPVRRGSRDHYEAMARSRHVVVSNYRPLHDWLQTPRGQVVVQTWHGAPFKRIALDNQRGEAFSRRDHLTMLRRETARWDYLLSPNPPSTPILRRAFEYDGQVLETGYPRTDVFHSPDRSAVAERVRSRLGIAEHETVVLYAPTMRDDHTYGGNRFGLDLRLDLDAAQEGLGDDHVLLVRPHAKVVDPVPAAGDRVRDVSLWPDVNELLLATDVLVTDYSSLVFDFANTGRPMLFFTYDLEDYRDRLRGLYFDPMLLPGPHLRTSDEVYPAIREAGRHRREHDRAYREFVATFCAWDDGKAAARFVDRVFAAHA